MAQTEVYAGIDIGGTNIKFGLCDYDGKVLHREHRPTMADKGATPLLHLVTNIAEQLLLYAAEEDYIVRKLGIGTPGAVDYNSGKIVGPCPNIGGWQGMELGTALRERLNIPVWVDNDVNAVALAEAKFGAAVGAQSVLFATVGTGVGGALLLDGQLWRGASYSAGELGHIPINFEGPKCRCGGHGCLEAYCASYAIIGRLKDKMSGGLTPKFKKVLDGNLDNLTIRKFFTAVHRGDELAREVMLQTALYLGIGLAGVVNLFNPETVVIGGGVADGGGGFVEAVADVVREKAFESAVKDLRVVKATLGNDAGFIGAGLLGLDQE